MDFLLISTCLTYSVTLGVDCHCFEFFQNECFLVDGADVHLRQFFLYATEPLLWP
jgi:hypothetical protein